MTPNPVKGVHGKMSGFQGVPSRASGRKVGWGISPEQKVKVSRKGKRNFRLCVLRGYAVKKLFDIAR